MILFHFYFFFGYVKIIPLQRSIKLFTDCVYTHGSEIGMQNCISDEPFLVHFLMSYKDTTEQSKIAHYLHLCIFNSGLTMIGWTLVT